MLKFLKDLFAPSSQIKIAVDIINPQTANEYMFYDYVAHAPKHSLETYMDAVRQNNLQLKEQYRKAIEHKLRTGEFKNPHAFPEYFGSSFDYIAIDFETANNSRISACAMGLCFVKDGMLVQEKTIYIKPPDGEKFSGQHTSIHGITARDVEDSKNFKELWDEELHKYMPSNHILLHNASMDASIIKQLVEHYKIDCSSITYTDTMAVAKKLGLPASLKDLCKAFGVKFANRHDPKEDAGACAAVYSEMLDRYPSIKSGSVELFAKKEASNVLWEKDGFKAKPTEESLELAQAVIAKYLISDVELQQLSIKGQTFIFTGEQPISRAECQRFIEDNGGLIKSGISGSIDFVVVGEGVGWSKLEKVKTLNEEKGKRIRILNENSFRELMNIHNKG